MQSGTVLVPWAFQPDPRGQAVLLAQQLGITHTSTQNLIDQLRNVPFQSLTSLQRGWLDRTVPRGFYPMDWVPCAEPPGVPLPRVITDNPVTLMRSGYFMQIPTMIGYMDVNMRINLW